MAIQELSVNRLLFLLAIGLISFPLCGQNARNGRLISNQLISPITREIRASIRKSDSNSKINCDPHFFSIKFIINTKTFICDTVIYSKSVYQELKATTSLLVKKNNIDWRSVLNELNHDCIKEKIEMILPIHLTRDKCPLLKLDEVSWWPIFNELIMIENRNLYEIVILSPVRTSIIDY
ncbi:MAG: hypothetical protein IM574_13180 [Cytophagales bacterium]|jgi:hypothetical protein|nr:hypothetical protein [Cytophagales bacterium]MCA6388704.1 hypothetical protein [Cytophagales bacterium]MCA6391975.1 hypothetical protein [Cytophagales bacterium]MCA6396016.1 hypothetical protein [Cytophagales bacterium]MCA6397468.1 hypothetical protein [Cytophagales bacterium]